MPDRLATRLDTPFRLGKKPPLRPYSAIKIKLANYLDLSLPAANFGWARYITDAQIPVFRNDTDPCCTITSQGHGDMVWERRTEGALSPVADTAIREAVEATGVEQGLGNGQGRYYEGTLSYWRRIGLRQPDGSLQKIVGYAVVNHLDINEVRAAGRIFGGLFIGASLPARAWYQMKAGQRWSMQPGEGSTAPGSWGGHAMYLPSWNAYGPLAFTWGDRQQATTAWWKQYTDECYVAVSEDWLNDAGVTPSGVNLAQLLTDLASI